jgi:hypothetical protein
VLQSSSLAPGPQQPSQEDAMAEEHLEFHPHRVLRIDNLHIETNGGFGIQICPSAPLTEDQQRAAAEWREIVRAKNPAVPPYVARDPT